MACIPIVAHGEESRIWVVRPDVCGFHAGVTIHAVGDRVPRQAFHPLHLPHATPGILDEIKLRLKLFDEFQHMPVHPVTELCVFTHRFEASRHRIFFPVVADRCNAEGRTVRAGPYDIGLAKEPSDILRRHFAYVLIQVNVLKIPRPFHTEHFMSPCFECFSNAPRSRE